MIIYFSRLKKDTSMDFIEFAKNSVVKYNISEKCALEARRVINETTTKSSHEEVFDKSFGIPFVIPDPIIFDII